MMNSILKSSRTRKILAAVFWLALWQAVYMAVDREILIVSPASVALILIENAQSPAFWLSIANSLARIMTGYTAALILGALSAALSLRFALAQTLLYLPVSIIKATPVASFIILALVWIKTSSVPGFTAFLMALPIVFTNVYDGAAGVDALLLEMADAYGFSQAKKLKYIYLPAVKPYFTAAATVSLGLAWKAGIAAEVIASPSATIGANLQNAKVYLETGQLFAWTAVIIIISVILEKAVRRILGGGKNGAQA